jgi:hypothetical protein
MAVAIAAVCVRLGFWQLDRHRQRVARNAVIEVRMGDVPVDVTLGVDPETFEYRRARVTGVFDYTREVIEQGRMVNGIPSVYVVTPLLTGSGRVILVERGYAISPDARGVDVGVLREPDSAVVEGVFMRLDGGGLPSDRSWPLYMRRADPAVLQPLFPETLEPLVLRRTVMPPDLCHDSARRPARGVGRFHTADSRRETTRFGLLTAGEWVASLTCWHLSSSPSQEFRAWSLAASSFTPWPAPLPSQLPRCDEAA